MSMQISPEQKSKKKRSRIRFKKHILLNTFSDVKDPKSVYI